MVKKAYRKLKGAYEFGGFHFVSLAVYDVFHHAKTKKKMIHTIIRECLEGGDAALIERKAASYFSMKTGQKIDYLVPKKYNEKIQWLMLYGSTSLKSELTDKYLVRAYITERIGDRYLIPLLGVWDNFEEIDLGKLPEQFVLKCNHGSGMNIVVKGKRSINWDYVRTQFNIWLETKFAEENFELQYSNIRPRIIAEEYIEQMDGSLYDYKVHCFNGVPKFIQVIGDRNLEAHTAKQLVYDFKWNMQKWTFGDYPKYTRELSKPNKLEELYDLSKRLGAGFDYVRVDFYVVDDRILFGEMTFSPNAGLYRYNADFTEAVDLMLGDLIDMREGKNRI